MSLRRGKKEVILVKVIRLMSRTIRIRIFKRELTRKEGWTQMLSKR